MIYDFGVIGGGIVGLATAMSLASLRPGASIVLIEKETALGRHQTGHNSGVIHSGIYYAPGSLKAKLCKEGASAVKEFCTEERIPFEICGKLLVATNALELQRMEALAERSVTHGIRFERLDAQELRRREPHIVGIGALYVDTTGIVDYKQVCEAMGRRIRQAGGRIEMEAAVTAIDETEPEVTIRAGEKQWQVRKLVACAGLQSDRLARLAGLKIEHQIVPFRGEYFELPAAKSDIVKHLIYPIPDPGLPFLGIHLTRMIDGSVTVGPNAVLGFAREGYRKFSFDGADVAEFMSFPGFWRLIGKNLKSGITELTNSLIKSAYLAECRKYCPSLTAADLRPIEAGIRAQTVMRNGGLSHDFMFLKSDRMLHVCNAPSPAATSAIPIGRMIAEQCVGGQ